MSRVAVLFPRIDIPFKEFKGLDLKTFELPESQKEVRRFWQDFLEVLEDTLVQSGVDYCVYSLPMWEITEAYVEQLNEEFVFIPHRTSDELSAKGKTCIYYMQVMTKWLFSLDVKGWSAASSKYPCREYHSTSEDPALYQQYVGYIVGEGDSKFAQTQRSSYLSLLLRRQIPWGKYIFFPCQIPHDQSIRYFSDYEEVDVIKSLCSWAETEGVKLVFKRHPANPKSMKAFEEIIGGCAVARWSDAHINDLISHSEAVYTINSGVGFESLLHNKPVVTFGRVEYDVVTTKATLSNLVDVWKAVSRVKQKEQLVSYRRFFNWYCNDYCVDLRSDRSLQLSNLKRKLTDIGIC